MYACRNQRDYINVQTNRQHERNSQGTCYLKVDCFTLGQKGQDTLSSLHQMERFEEEINTTTQIPLQAFHRCSSRNYPVTREKASWSKKNCVQGIFFGIISHNTPIFKEERIDSKTNKT